MKVPAKFREYIWLVETISKAKRITLQEINERWLRTEMSGGVDLVRSTFNRHRDAIAEIFGVYIECDRSDGYRYYIMNSNDLKQDNVQNWMLTTLSVNTVLLDSLNVHNRILLEQIPSDGSYVRDVVEAMKEGKRLRIVYQKYGQADTSERVVEPYCIKLYRQRWYMLVRQVSCDGNESVGMRLFAFDRINEIVMQKESFKVAKDFDAAEYFADSYGVVTDDGAEVETVVVRAFGSERYYLRDLPVHHSQREIGHGEGWTDFEVCLRPTLDLMGQILSRGARQKVMRPQWLADEVRKMHLEAAGLYGE